MATWGALGLHGWGQLGSRQVTGDVPWAGAGWFSGTQVESKPGPSRSWHPLLLGSPTVKEQDSHKQPHVGSQKATV